MCLAIPGKILSINSEDGLQRTGMVSFGEIVKDVNFAYLPEAQAGQYVVVHAGFAISALDQSEANRVFEYLREIEEATEIEA